MPNEIFLDMKEWISTGELKSNQHQEFIYTYYWLMAYLWRYAIYAEQKLGQQEIKKILKYNPNEKRIDYIMKKNSLLDQKGYTAHSNDYPVLWSFKSNENVKFDMLYEFDETDRGYMTANQSSRFFVKSPVKHIGDDENEGIYWNSSNTHIVSGEVLAICMDNPKLGCSGFYLYGLLTFIRDKSGESSFGCSSSTISTYTGWGANKIYDVTTALVLNGLIVKSQDRKTKGCVNMFQILI